MTSDRQWFEQLAALALEQAAAAEPPKQKRSGALAAYVARRRSSFNRDQKCMRLSMNTNNRDARLKTWMGDIINKQSLPNSHALLELMITDSLRHDRDFKRDGESAADYRRLVEKLLTEIMGDRAKEVVTTSDTLRADGAGGGKKLSLSPSDIKALAKLKRETEDALDRVDDKKAEALADRLVSSGLGVGQARGAFSVREGVADDAGIRLAMDGDARYQAPTDDARAAQAADELARGSRLPTADAAKSTSDLLKAFCQAIENTPSGELPPE
jgi:hypothetical protein